MKSIGLGLLCLLGCSLVARAQQHEELASELQSPSNVAAPLPIFLPTFLSTDETFALSTAVKLNWFQAQAACASQGYTLVSIRNHAAQSLLFTRILGSKQLTSLTEPIWTSGTNLASPYKWSWFSTGETFTYRNFQSSPNGEYRCLGFNAVTNYWTADDCTVPRYFACEKSCE